MEIVSLQIEIFLLLIVGFYLSKKGILSKETRKQLTNIVLMVVLPCAIIKSFQIELNKDLLIATGVVLLISCGIQVVYWIFNLFLWRGIKDEGEQICCKYGTMVSNAGFMGMPIAEGVYGPLGLLYASIFLLPQRICMWSYGLSMYAKGESGNVFKKVMTHPCIVALFIGIAVMILQNFGITIPGPIDDTIGAIGKCNTALSMIVIGGILSDVNIKEMFDKVACFYSVIRLIVLPLVILVIVRLLKIETMPANLCVLLSAMPAASTTAMLAEKYNKAPEFASKLIFVSTLASLVTLPLLLLLMKYI